MHTYSPRTRAAAAAIATLSLAAAGCASTQHSTTSPSTVRTVPSGPPAADLSDIDRYVDADPIKRYAIEGWVITTTNQACTRGSTDQNLPDQVAARGRQAGQLGGDYGRVIRSNWGPTTLPATKVDAGPIPTLTPGGESWCDYRGRVDAWIAAKKAKPIVDGAFIDTLYDSDLMKPLALRAWVLDTATLQCSTRRDDPDARAEAVRRAQKYNENLPQTFPNERPLALLSAGQDWCAYAAASRGSQTSADPVGEPVQ